MLDDRLQKRGDRGDLAAPAQRLAGRFGGVQHGTPAANQQRLGHGEMEKANLIGGAVQPADEVGEDAVDASVIGMQLLMLVGGDEELPCRGRK
jgi:hypothetical protein